MHASEVVAQDNYPKYWISFTDKKNTPYSVDRPDEFLSVRAIERRRRQGINITQEDLPVDPEYLDQLHEKGIIVIHTSRWFNGAIVELNDTTFLDTLLKLDFIQPEIVMLKPSKIDTTGKEFTPQIKTVNQPMDTYYGSSYNQIAMLHGDRLHASGYKGEGMLIAILDAGFKNANIISSLRHLWTENKVIATKDFVNGESSFYHTHQHGTVVFSILGGLESGKLIGSAPEATYALIRTEDAGSEYLIEEYYWICGAEYADSIGADIINSSVVYVNFYDPSQNHTYSDMDGKTTPASRAASKAAARGIIVVNGAGNWGNEEWARIGTPADADSILTVGATDPFGIIRGFSSMGPSYDGRIKPDVVAQGYFTIGQEYDGDFFYSAGTSAATPIIAGMAACLWQANPQWCNMEIIDAIRKSSSQYFTPDSVYGYGIPDMYKADLMLRAPEELMGGSKTTFTLFPNPATDQFYLQISRPESMGNESITLQFYDLFGILWKEETREISGGQFILEFHDISDLPEKLYILKINLTSEKFALFFSKF
jgi:hypothetical protein